ncbi:MAG: alpha/beta hydrolase-fold protein [Ignavibacteriaceae bacterium]
MNTELEISKNNFQKILDEINTALTKEEKLNLINSLINKIKKNNYPLFENDSTVILLYQGDIEKIEVIGDMTNWEYGIPMKKIKDTNLFYLRGRYEPNARLEYWLRLSENDFPFTDPLNSYKSLNGLGELSELVMPGYEPHPYFDDYKFGKKGGYESLREFKLFSEVLNYDHTIHIYIPPGYDSQKKYSSVYFQDGRDYIEFAVVPHVLNELIKSQIIEPLIAVFVTPPNLHQPAVPNRMTEYGLNDNYVKFFVDELVPFVDSNFSTKKNYTQRLVAGESYGGLISTYISFSHPEIFGMAYSQSGYHSFQKDKMIYLLEINEQKPVKLYVDIGTYERKVGSSFISLDETDFLAANRRLRKALLQKNYNFIYKEYFEGHTWGNWRRHLIDALIYFFKKK